MIGLRVKSSPLYDQYTHAILGVSLYSQSFEDDALQVMCDFINKNYSSVIIDLTDTNNRHAIRAENNISINEAYRQSLKDGYEWITHAQPILNTLTVPYEIIRWDHWHKDERYVLYKKQFELAFERNKIFKEAVLKDIEAYCVRHHGTSIKDTPFHILQGCKNYILEEITCHSIMYEDRRSATIYPGKSLECYKVVREGLVDNIPLSLQNSYHVRVVLHGIQPKAAQNEEMLQAA